MQTFNYLERREKIRILKGNLGERDHPCVERRRNDKPHTYGLHVSQLHANAVMIMAAETKRRLPWENERDVGA